MCSENMKQLKTSFKYSTHVPERVSLMYITHPRLRLLRQFCLSEHQNFIFNTQKVLFSQQQRRCLKLTLLQLGAQLIQKGNFFYFLYLFRDTTLKQLPIKKLYKVVTGKTVSKSTMSANQPPWPLCSLAIPFIPCQNKTC